ncbi:hypothetical protein ZIOFF_065403 [Zingiber officinale]|uniref:Uncharacterized protein n=1 Tax=Zingiber officinale TaxID=94328 RepID=A0A8J5EXA2_ZINOF|nr:hypothetical protein ZIOFF_065403 [Zingiber officinale]
MIFFIWCRTKWCLTLSLSFRGRRRHYRSKARVWRSKCYQGRATIGGEVEAAEVQARINGSILPPWMLNHLNG